MIRPLDDFLGISWSSDPGALPPPSPPLPILPPPSTGRDTTDPEGPPCPPQFALVERVGRGGMGEVWKAKDLQLGRWVALKFLREGANAEAQARFRREAEMVSQLSHPSITAVHGVGQEKGHSYIVMQFIPGRTLSEWPNREVRARVGVVRDVARAMSYAHARGVLHRDLKPSNILVEDGPGPSERHVFITDFGLAKCLSHDVSLTATGQVLGTPPYMSPGQVRGEETDARDDIYALGATLYAAVTGRPPFRGTNPLQILRKVLEEDPPRLKGELGAVISKAMAKDRDARYPSADAMADDLDRWLAGDPVQAKRVSLPALWARKLKRRKRFAAGVLAAAVALMGFPLLFASPSAEMRAEAAHEAALGKVNEYLLAAVTGDRRRASLEEGAILALEAALAADDARPMAWVWLGRCRYLRGEDPRPAWTSALLVKPGHAEALLERSRHRLDRGEREAARADYQAALRTGARSALAECVNAALMLETSPAEAEAALGAYLQGAGWDASAFRLRARARGLLGRHREAEADFVRAVDLAPANPVLLFERGAFHHEQGRLTAAERDYSRALELKPRWPAAIVARGRVALEQQIWDRAETEFRRAVEVEPGLVAAHVLLGCALDGQGRAAEAEAHFTKAIFLDPGCAEAYLHRGRMTAARGRPLEAAKDWERALELDPRLATRVDVLRKP